MIVKNNVFTLRSMPYWAHLKANVNIAIHAQKDVIAHLIHGFIPFIEISHHGPHKSHNPKTIN